MIQIAAEIIRPGLCAAGSVTVGCLGHENTYVHPKYYIESTHEEEVEGSKFRLWLAGRLVIALVAGAAGMIDLHLPCAPEPGPFKTTRKSKIAANFAFGVSV